MKWLEFLSKDNENILIRVGFLAAIAVVCLGIHFWERHKKRKQDMQQFRKDLHG